MLHPEIKTSPDNASKQTNATKAGGNGISLPAVGILQKREDQEEEKESGAAAPKTEEALTEDHSQNMASPTPLATAQATEQDAGPAEESGPETVAGGKKTNPAEATPGNTMPGAMPSKNAAAEPKVKITPRQANGGSADTTLNFFDAPATEIATGINSFGNAVVAGLQIDKAQLAASTPPVSSHLNPDSIGEPEKPAVAKNKGVEAPKAWAAPRPNLRKDAPKFKPSAEANPQQAETEAAAKSAQVSASAGKVNTEIAKMPGEELVQGHALNPTAQVELAASKANIRTKKTPEIDAYLAMDLDDGFRQQVDAASAGMFSQSLAGPRSQVENAKLKRDQDHSDAVASASLKAEELGKKASDEQAQRVNESRSLIGAEKEKSLAESKATLEEYDGKVSREKQAKLDEINAQITSHENQANNALNEADSKIANEQKKADKEKAEEEKKAEEKKKKRKWWQVIGDFFSGIAKALANVVKSIVNALASVVRSIVNAARSLANSIISACTSLVKKLLDTFANVVKGFLNLALAAFPGIRDRLNAAIDKFVSKAKEAVDKVAQGLKDSIDSICDTLTKIVDFAQNYMVSVIEGAVLLFEAIISGNFADIPRIAFMTACNALGLPGEELWAIVLKAADQAMNIIKNPGSFLSNLIKAGEKGFMQFVNNIKQHLISGLMGWLFGQVAQTGITIPEKFDGASIFLLIRQILGVTYEYVRERAVSLIGEKNTQRVEMVLTYLKRLFTEGPEVLFEELKGKAEEVKQNLMEQIEDWVITTVIKKAVIKVTSMLIPGSGFVQAIYGLWQTIQFFIENIKKIAAVVNSLLDSLAEISRGAIASAANFVEKTMVDTLPLVFAWLAKLIGIDGIGQKVKSIIDKLRTPVNTAVDFVIRGAMKLGSKVVDKVKSGANSLKDKAKALWNKRKEFKTLDGEIHAVYVEKNNVVVNPVPKQNVEDFLSKAETRIPEEAKQKQALLKDIMTARDTLKKLKGDLVDLETTGKKETQIDRDRATEEKEAKAAEKELGGLATLLHKIMDATGNSLTAETKNKQDTMSIDQVLAEPPHKGERNEEQKKTELDQVVSLSKRIIAQSETTSQIEKYFPKLTARYRLTKIGFVADGEKYNLRVEINPVTYLPANKVLMTGTTLDGLCTNVTWDTATLGGVTVGKKMTASLLGPDHTQGGPPSGGQKSLMNKLPTDPTYSNEYKYIRGHLLNDNLGGEGEDYNLFPITGNANSEHAHKVEETVKRWVNDDRYWVTYTVDVESISDSLVNSDKTKNYVNATFKCSASILHADGKKARTITASIKSEKGKSHSTAKPQVLKDTDKLPGIGPGAKAVDVKLSTTKGDVVYELRDELRDIGAAILTLDSSGGMLSDALSKIDGYAAETSKLYLKLIKNKSHAVIDGEKATLTKLNKEGLDDDLKEKLQEVYDKKFSDSLEAAKEKYEAAKKSFKTRVKPGLINAGERYSALLKFVTAAAASHVIDVKNHIALIKEGNENVETALIETNTKEAQEAKELEELLKNAEAARARRTMENRKNQGVGSKQSRRDYNSGDDMDTSDNEGSPADKKTRYETS